MSSLSVASVAPAARVVVPAGTTAGTAVREAGLPGKGPDAVVVVRDPDGRLRDLSWVAGRARSRWRRSRPTPRTAAA